MNQDILRIIRAAALAVAKECDAIAYCSTPEAPPPVPDTPPTEAEAPKPKAPRAKKAEAPPAPAVPEPVTPPTSEEAASNVVDFIPEATAAAAPTSKSTLADVQAYAYSIGKKANGGNSTEAGTKAKNWLLKNFNVAGIDAIPDVGDNYDRVLEMLKKVGATDSRLPAAPPAPEDEL